MATRNFRLLGDVTSDGVTGSITIDGVEVYNGPLNKGSEIIAEGSADINDSTEITLPVEIVVTSGNASIGTLFWNYGQIENPLLTPEEKSYIIPGSVTDTGEIITRIQIAPTLPPEIKASVADKGGFFIKSESVFATGDTDELRTSNRSNLKIDDVAVVGPSWYFYMVPEGSKMTYDLTISPRA